MSRTEVPPGLSARRLLRAADRATLATRLAGGGGPALDAWPYASLVLLACDHDATPLLLISDLAEHSRNIAGNARVSLLIDGTAGRVDPLTGPRVTLLGTAERADDGRLKARFVARHPAAALYADFGDFHLYRVAVTRGHFVAGFGRIHWIEAVDMAGTAVAELMTSEPELIERLNRRAEAIARLATRGGATGWRVTGVDGEGLDLRREGQVARLDWPEPVASAAAVEPALDALLAATQARRRP